jgi:hypothetical protein
MPHNPIKSEVNLSQQNSHDAEPFGVQWLSGNGLPRPTIPVKCVVLITFFCDEGRREPTNPRGLRPAEPIRGPVSNPPWHPTIGRGAQA